MAWESGARCKAFDRGVGFPISRVIAPGILTIILGFGKSQYIGNTSNASVEMKRE